MKVRASVKKMCDRCKIIKPLGCKAGRKHEDDLTTQCWPPESPFGTKATFRPRRVDTCLTFFAMETFLEHSAKGRDVHHRVRQQLL